MTKVLVTGAAGFIGSHVVDLLLAEGHNVQCLDDLSTGKKENLPKGIDIAKVNVANWFDLVAEFVDFEPETVIHLAAQPSLGDSFDNPIRDGSVNIMGTLNMIRAAQKIGVTKFVFSSTSAVYVSHPLNKEPLDEEYPILPNSPYGISKFAAESYLRLLMPKEYVVLRFANVYGPRQVPIGENQVVPKMILHFLKGEEFKINGNGNNVRDYVYVEDVARACVLALEANPCTINVASQTETTVNDLAKLMGGLYEVDGYNWEYDQNKVDPREYVCMKNWRAKALLGWQPEVSLINGLARTIKWWDAQNEN